MIGGWLLLAPAAWAGSLHGQVVDPDGEPVRNATVVVYDERLNYRYQGTAADGLFAFEGLAQGWWRIRVIPSPQDPWLEQWAWDTLQVCAAERFEVGETAGEDVTVALARGGALAGTLLDGAGEPVAGVLVSGRPVAAQPILLRADTTGADGRFLVQGLAPGADTPGIYRLEVQGTGWPTQSLDGAYLAPDAATWEVDAGQTVEVGTHTLLDGASLAGTATGPDGPVATGAVRAYSGSQVVEGVVQDGVWALVGVPPGEVLPWVRAEGYATTWWPDADRPGARVTVGEGEARSDVDLDLPFEAVLRARVEGGSAAAGLNVLAYNDDQTVAVGAVTDAQGAARIGRLHGGRYTLYVFGAGAGFIDDFVRDEDGDPVSFEVPAEGETEEHVLALPLGASLSGTATDAASGLPVYGATIHAVSQDSGAARAVASARDGTWAIPGLLAGTWEVWADYTAYCATDPDWAPVYYPDRVNPALVGVVRLRAGEDLAWDPALPPDADHDGMDDAWEAEHGLDPTRADGDEDPDGDGFSNLDEYLLGTDPGLFVASEGACGGCGGGAAFVVLLPIAPWWQRRRKR